MTDKINLAIEECLATGRGEHSPYARTTAYLDKLRSDSGWSEQEVLAVAMAVFRVQSRISSGEDEF